MRYAQLVVGPAGSGKSTYCSVMVEHAAASKRVIEVVNLDPAAEHFDYEPIVDVRELIHVQDTMEDADLSLGPNGGLVFCIEYLLENSDWLRDQLGEGDNDYILFDCPGQIELYTHLTAMKQLAVKLQDWHFNVCCVYLVDAGLMIDAAKYISGAMCAQTIMLNLELPHINLVSKMDLISKSTRKTLHRFFDADCETILFDLKQTGGSAFHKKYRKLSESIAELIEKCGIVGFIPLYIKDPQSLTDILTVIDNTISYAEDQDVRTYDFEEERDDD